MKVEELAKKGLPVPMVLFGLPVEWSGYVPRGGWDYCRVLFEELVPHYRAVNAEMGRDIQNWGRNKSLITEAARQSKDIQERIVRFMGLAQEKFTDGQTVLSIMQDLHEAAKKEGKPFKGVQMQEFADWMNTTNGVFLMLAEFCDREIRELDSDKGRKREIEEDIAVSQAEVDLQTGYLQFDILEYALVHAPAQYKTKLCREIVKTLKPAVAAANLLDNKLTHRIVAKAMASEEARRTFNQITTTVRKAEKDYRTLKRMNEQQGADFWKTWEAAQRDANGFLKGL